MPAFLAPYYQYIYLFFVTILTFTFLSKYKNSNNESNSNQSNSQVAFLILVFFIVFIGLRPLSGRYFVDMGAYAMTIDNLLKDVPFVFSWNTDNVIFDNLAAWWASINLGSKSFFILLAFIYFGASFRGIKRLFPSDTLLAYCVFLGAFSTFSFATNGMKAGCAASIFILALSYLDKPFWCIFFAALSLGFHHAMQVPIVALIIVLLVKIPKYFYYGWGLCLLMSMLHVTFFQNLFGSMTDEHGSQYLILDNNAIPEYIGFRPDFVLYSIMPIAIGYYFEFKKRMVSKLYSILIHFYITTNAVWLLCMYSESTNRIAYLSWSVYPIVIIYPFLDKINTDPNRYKTFNKVVKYHLYFTLFMNVIYYGILNLSFST